MEAQRSTVFRELDLVMHGDAQANNNPIQEQLRKCPEAFKVGEAIGRLCDRLRFDREGGDRLLPPAGLIMPPLI
jgi:hypothetical protein